MIIDFRRKERERTRLQGLKSLLLLGDVADPFDSPRVRRRVGDFLAGAVRGLTTAPPAMHRVSIVASPKRVVLRDHD